MTPAFKFAVIVAGLMFISYLGIRDRVKVECDLPRKDVKEIVGRLEEWSAPKLFRQMEIEGGRDRQVHASVREPGERWSVTVFSNSESGWKKVGWFLAKADHSIIK
jgi:hypothetical protein